MGDFCAIPLEVGRDLLRPRLLIGINSQIFLD
jgi:hypothetical protein